MSVFDINYPKKWVPVITAIKYVKYQLEADDKKFRDITTYFLKADWTDKYHVIIEDKELDTPDYYFFSEEQILEHFGELEFLSNL